MIRAATLHGAETLHKPLGTQPDFGTFDPAYYGKTYTNVKNKYKEYEDNDDIDVTEGYGKDN